MIEKLNNIVSPKLVKVLSLTLILAILIITIISCGPQSKESYMDNYKEFIKEVSEEGGNYTEKDWEKTDKEHEKYTGKWHEKFKDDFIWKDKLLLTKYGMQYKLYKFKSNPTDIEVLYKSYAQLKEQIKYYSENDMEKDLESLIEGANELGETATETLEEVLKELNIESN